MSCGSRLLQEHTQKRLQSRYGDFSKDEISERKFLVSYCNGMGTVGRMTLLFIEKDVMQQENQGRRMVGEFSRRSMNSS
jgi:hypothetical protein